MDLILGSFAEKHIDSLSEDQLETYEKLLNEADQDIYQALVDIIYGNGIINENLTYGKKLLEMISNSTIVAQ